MDADRVCGLTGGGAGFLAGAFCLYPLIATVSVLFAWCVQSICGLSFAPTYDFTGAGTGFLTVRDVVGGFVDMFSSLYDDNKGSITCMYRIKCRCGLTVSKSWNGTRTDVIASNLILSLDLV